MSVIARQALVLAIAGLAIVFVALRLARHRKLSPRYSVGWIGTGLLVMLGAALMPFVGRLGRLADMTPTAVLLLLSSVGLLALTIQLSISVSGLQERLRSVAEAQALLEFRNEFRSEADARNDD